MCEHREHRTGNCQKCHPLAAGGLVQPNPELIAAVLRNNEYILPMPQLWEGDDN